MFGLTSLILLISLFISVYIYIKRKFTYWERLGVPFVKPKIPFGNLEVVKITTNFNLQIRKMYQELKGKGPIGGFYVFVSPIVLAVDIDFIKNVLIKDFHYFQDRGVYFNEKDDPLSAHLIALNSDKWSQLRNKLSPTFTSGKMKFMFPTVVDVAERFKTCLRDLIDDSMDLEIRDLMARFTTDVIGTCAFGIECNSLNNPNAEFRTMGRKIFDEPRYNPFIQLLMQNFPDLSRKLHLKTIRDDVSDFFMNIVTETVKFREQNDVHRNDFMDLLINLKNQEKDSLSLNEIAAQAFLFFLAGFETSSTSLQYAFYELAVNPEIQTKLRDEINSVLQKHNDHFTYDAMMAMPYMDQVINETLRKHPPFGTLIREVTKPYKVPRTDVTLPVRTPIFLSAYAIQHDDEFYPNPEKFIPERFSAEQIETRPSVSFLTFGDGPRNCIGLRFGMMEMRVALVAVLQNFEILKCSKTPDKIEYSKTNVTMVPERGMWLKLKKLN